MTPMAIDQPKKEDLQRFANKWLEGDAGSNTDELRLAAVVHAGQRLEPGLNLTQLINEVRILRTVILRLCSAPKLWQTSGTPPVWQNDYSRLPE